MEDMHIHLKNAIYDQELFEKYIQRCINCGLQRVVFLDHGNRISTKHKPVLFTQESIDQFNKKISDFKKTELSNKIEIIRGIEIDYSDDSSFRRETFNILKYGKFEWIIGAIHSLKFDNYGQYLAAIIDMLNNYDIKVIAHIKKIDDCTKYNDLFKQILNICHERKILIEINTSDRSRWDEKQLYYMLDLMEQYVVNYVFSSDAHNIEEIGYMIKETEEKVEKWKKRKK